MATLTTIEAAAAARSTRRDSRAETAGAATPAHEWSYDQRIQRLHEIKLRQTREKLDRRGPVDGDDHGSIMPPQDFVWHFKPNHPNGSFYGARAWAENFRSLMDVHPVYVEPADAFVGRWMFCLWPMRPEWWHPDFESPELREQHKRYGIIAGIGGPHHFCPDYAIGLALGWGGLLEKVRHFGTLHSPGKAEFYQALEDVILGVQTWIRRTTAATREKEEQESDPVLRANLRAMAKVNEWIVERPPRTLREACQWIAWFNMVSRTWNGDGAGCRLDVVLRPYFERDLADGRIDEETAIFYLSCLLLNDAHYYQIGGPDADGRDVTSRLSFLILEAAHRMAIPCNLTVRVHDGLDQDLFLQSVRYLFEDRNAWPRYMGDKGMNNGFVRNGYPMELARQRIAVGCHWAAIPGREYTLNDVVKINIARVFEVAFRDMLDGPAEKRCIAELQRLFEEHLRRAVLCTARGIDLHLEHQWEVAPELMIDLLCHGPVEKGLDASHGGVEFYNMCVDGAGLATVADSFAALEQRIEREGVLTWDEIGQHIRGNFSGPDGERVRLMMKAGERYGQGSGLGEEWALRITRSFTQTVKAGPTPAGYNMIPGWFSWADTIKLGRPMGATPNGRRAAEPISTGANPDPGFRRDGAPTAMARSIAAVQPGYGNTAPMQLELSPGLSREQGGIEKIASLIKTHFDLGGTLFNINILDGNTLRAAHKDPTKYPDLVVRVTGFTAYFASLSPEYRQLVLNRMIEEDGPQQP